MLIKQREKIPLKNKFRIFFYIQMTNIRLFKDTFLAIFISHFRDKSRLLPQIVEMDGKLIMRVEDLKQLISILLNQPKENILIETEESDTQDLNPITEITQIMIDGKYLFDIDFEDFYEQMEKEFFIHLDYVLIPKYHLLQAYLNL
jgi:hypothetical protein